MCYKKFILIIFVFLTNASIAFSQVFFEEDFEHEGALPETWTQEYIHDNYDWRASPGGHTETPSIPGSRKPPEAFEGEYNAMFEKLTLTNATTRFITPKIDLTFAIKAQLRFYHAQLKRTLLSGGTFNDKLKIYGKYTDELDNVSWVLLASYEEEVPEWTLRTINIPDSLNQNNFQIAFEGITGPGWGVCVDSVSLIENGLITRYIDRIEVKQPVTSYVPSGSLNNPILRVDFSVKGNQGEITLDSMLFESLNDAAVNLTTDGLKIYASNDTLFRNVQLLSTPGNYVSQEHLFTGIDYSFETGVTSIWLTYDMPASITHDLHGAVLDAMIPAGGIRVEGQAYPIQNASPSGHRELAETLFFDDFETDKGWSFTTEFQRGAPQGEGGINYGFPDPLEAHSGVNVIGTDLEGLGSKSGDYENLLVKDQYDAETPTINTDYFANMEFKFQRWLNIESFDTARIYYDLNGDNQWKEIWRNKGVVLENRWNEVGMTLPEQTNFNNSIRLKFTLGGTDDYTVYSGLNIDDLALVGNFISYDIGVVQYLGPTCNCYHTSQEQISVKVTNRGYETASNIPIGFSFDGGETWTMDEIAASIASNDTITYTFSEFADFSNGGWYDILIKTFLPEDEIPENDMLQKDQFMPYREALPYYTGFETDDGRWHITDTSDTWERGVPNYDVINETATGNKAWVTKLTFNYTNNANALLEGPCFDLSQLEKPVFECKVWGQINDEGDGLTLMYSIDGGETWQPVADDQYYNWNWYNNQTPNPPATTAWDTSSTDWIVMRTILPDALDAYDYVKFGFLFTSDEGGVSEGVAVDDVAIYESPLDFTVSALNYPQTDCEWPDTTHVKINIENKAPVTALSGTEVPVKFIWQEQHIVTDTVILDQDLAPDTPYEHLYSATVPMDSAGDYDFKFITLYEDDPYYYGASNDTTTSLVSVNGMPQYNPFPPITGKPSGSVDLDAGAGYTGYAWSTGYTGQVLSVFADDTYTVTVTNGEGCTAVDSTEVITSTDDLEMNEVLTSIDNVCLRPNPFDLEVRIFNRGEEHYGPGEEIPLAFQLNGMEPYEDTLVLADSLHIDSSINYTYSQQVDMSESRQHTLVVYANNAKDLNRADDTLSIVANTWGTPQPAVTGDTVFSSRIDTLSIDAGEGFDSYLWQDASTSRYYDVNSDIAQWYHVTVDDVHGCGPTDDSVYVNTNDLYLTSLESPIDACEHSTTEYPSVRVYNNSGNLIPAGENIQIGFSVNNGTAQTETLALPANLEGGNSQVVTLTNSANLADTGVYNFVVWVKATEDANHENDSLTETVFTYGYPNVDLAYDSIYTLTPDTLEFDAGEGFASYLWYDGATSQTHIADRDTSFVYSVTVSNEDGCGTDSDSVFVFTQDLRLVDINRPLSSCELSDQQLVRLKIYNNSADKLLPGTVIPGSYKVNNGSWHNEEFILNDTIVPGAQFFMAFEQTVDMSSGNYFNIEAAIHYATDANRNNDSASSSVDVWGYPEYTLNYDFVSSTQPDTVELIVTPGNYAGYMWNVGVDNDTLSLEGYDEPWYAVTVTTINGCSKSDTVYVNSKNLTIDQLLAPVDACAHTTTENVSIRIKNTGSDTVYAGNSMTLEITSPETISENYNFSNPLAPGDSIDYTFTGNLDLSEEGNYQVEVTLNADFDANSDDNVLVETITTHGPADVNLGNEITVSSLPFVLDAGAGFESYVWHDNSTDQTFDIDETNITGTGLYSVTVTNNLGCQGSDSRRVNVDIIDWSADDVLSPETGCYGINPPVLILRMSNQSSVPIREGRSFFVNYVLNGDNTEQETFTLTDSVYPQESYDYTFNVVPDFNAYESNVIEILLDNAGDINNGNDAITHTLTPYIPELEFGQDSIKPEDFPYILTAPDGLEDYEWSTGEFGQSIEVDEQGWYTVTAYDDFDCAAMDSVFIVDPTGLSDLTANGNRIEIWPNPAKNTVWIDLNRTTGGKLHYELVTTAGEVVHVAETTMNKGEIIELSIDHLAPGMYLFRFYDNDEYGNRSLIIK
ncbi:hypothetical protein L21SP5_03559 [Salinivirga cyanobacteriivorans]|uniref:Secretion system C-terminal sorting domain-containing protein n=1 Tax=Salinivirga cyanobacteriivorans TaxID=1307839 RepID=A0A0S2I496_9BACT|nr:T9SS type A sorting domain-containing protein [Salinivirga cyanobacteriivorans]ALO17167.1 hypothetical protein L21SP5_03559 [Salinivirga cyanobacteriivorans]